MPKNNILNEDELWYKDGIIYQVHIKAFNDSNNDGMGDLPGLTEKLDYIKSLGVTIIWVLPFYPSPMKDDGYDIADYMNINPDYGTLEDFKNLLEEAHKKNIRVVTELVLNHTSDQHEWFKRARASKPDSVERNFYVWSETTEKYKDARVIFSDFENSNWTFDHTANAYFWHRFYSHQPDLNFENPEVHKALFKVVDFWFELGIDGLRLDAVPYLYEKEGTNCENLFETHQFLKKFSAYIKNKFKNKMLLAEANQWPEDAVEYFGDGDECQMAFHFPLMPRMYLAVQMETRFPIIDILEQTPDIPANCQWAMFLRNHDELTLEMVTDEERDFMYMYYARDKRARVNLGIRRRLAPLVENNRRKIELLNILLFSFPGTPIIYYGDEIGMGDNYYLGDRNGVRTPMQWSPDRNAGFSNANPQRLFLPVIIDPEYNYETVNVEVQERNSSSLLRWMKKTIAVRKNYKAFGRGTIEFLNPNNTKVLAFYRKFENENILVVANLSRLSQAVELDLCEFAGYTPVDVFSRNKFPVVKDDFYTLTLNAYDYYWFSLVKREERKRTEREVPQFSFENNLQSIFNSSQKKSFEKNIILNYLDYTGLIKIYEDKIEDLEIISEIKISPKLEYYILFISLSYIENPSAIFLLTFAYAEGEKAEKILTEEPNSVLAINNGAQEKSILFEGVYDDSFRKQLLNNLLNTSVNKAGAKLIFLSNSSSQAKEINETISSTYINVFSNMYNIFYDDKLVLKLYRRLEMGIGAGEEILNLLTKNKFKNTLPLISPIQYLSNQGEPITVGLLNKNITNHGTAYDYFTNSAEHYYESILSRDKEELKCFAQLNYLLDDLEETQTICETLNPLDLDNSGLIGKITADMHNNLSSADDNPIFKTENFNQFYNRSLYQTIRSNVKLVFQTLKQSVNSLDKNLQELAEQALTLQDLFLNYLEKIINKKISAKKIRIHGDYHLGQLLFTGKDFIITDFEGQPLLGLSEKKLRRSSLRDVASMLYSFRYAAFNSLSKYQVDLNEKKHLENFAEQWWLCISNNFLDNYFLNLNGNEILPDDKTELKFLINIYFIDKIISELSYELSNKTDKILIPLKSLLRVSKQIRDKV